MTVNSLQSGRPRSIHLVVRVPFTQPLLLLDCIEPTVVCDGLIEPNTALATDWVYFAHGPTPSLNYESFKPLAQRVNRRYLPQPTTPQLPRRRLQYAYHTAPLLSASTYVSHVRSTAV